MIQTAFRIINQMLDDWWKSEGSPDPILVNITFEEAKRFYIQKILENKPLYGFPIGQSIVLLPNDMHEKCINLLPKKQTWNERDINSVPQQMKNEFMG